MYYIVTFLKHFKFGRAAATTSPAPAVGEGQSMTGALVILYACNMTCIPLAVTTANMNIITATVLA